MKVYDVVTASLAVCSQRSWTAQEAMKMIIGQFRHTGRVFYSGQWWSIPDFYLRRELETALAESVEIMFWGGPDPDRRFHKGTVLDYLIDCCMYEISQDDPYLKLWGFLDRMSSKGRIMTP